MKNLGGSPTLITNAGAAREWLQEKDENRLKIDKMERPSTKWVFVNWIQVEVKAIMTNQQGSSRTGTHGNAVPVLFHTTGTSFPLFFFFSILQLLTVILSSLIFISLVGPPLTQFNPLPYVKKWLAYGHRDSQSRKHARKRHPTEESRYSHLNKIFE